MSILRFVLKHSLFLLVGAVAALAWANSAPASYEWFAHHAHGFANDVGMAFFFGIATVHIVKATRPGGGLDSPRHLIVPVAAAIGGMVVPALIFVAIVLADGRADLVRGWAIPCATDIAFSYLIAKLIFGAKHPATAFLLLLAVVDDALGLGILAIVYPPEPVRPLVLAIVLAAMACAWIMRRYDVRSVWPYLVVPGILSWVGLHYGGLHPGAGAGADPAVRAGRRRGRLRARLPPARRGPAVPVRAGQRRRARLHSRHRHHGGSRRLDRRKTARRPALHARRRLVRRPSPRRCEWLDLTIVGLAAGIGFTVSLFFAVAAFPSAEIAGEMKMGALLSGFAGVLALGIARLSRPVYNTTSSR